MNNFEKIKNMAIDEMAKAFDKLNVDCTGLHCPARDICELIENTENCIKPFKQWLQQESEG